MSKREELMRDLNVLSDLGAGDTLNLTGQKAIDSVRRFARSVLNPPIDVQVAIDGYKADGEPRKLICEHLIALTGEADA